MVVYVVQCSGHTDSKACPRTPSRFFPSSTWNRGGVWIYGKCKLGVIPQERLKIAISYYLVLMICRVDWHNNGRLWVTLNGCFSVSASGAISAVANLSPIRRMKYIALNQSPSWKNRSPYHSMKNHPSLYDKQARSQLWGRVSSGPHK